MKNSELRLPKLVENDPRSEKIIEILNSKKCQLWSSSKLELTSLPSNEKFIQALQMEHRKGHIVRGFEMVERKLESEAMGMSLVDEKTDSKRGERISRLLLISNDGSERYYRKLETLIKKHSKRILPIKIEIDSTQLGELFFGHGKTAKLMLLEHKKAVASALFSLVETS